MAQKSHFLVQVTGDAVLSCREAGFLPKFNYWNWRDPVVEEGDGDLSVCGESCHEDGSR